MKIFTLNPVARTKCDCCDEGNELVARHRLVFNDSGDTIFMCNSCLSELKSVVLEFKTEDMEERT